MITLIVLYHEVLTLSLTTSTNRYQGESVTVVMNYQNLFLREHVHTLANMIFIMGK